MSARSFEDLNNPQPPWRDLLRRRDTAAAVRALEQAAKNQPDSLPIAFDLGRAYGALGRFEEARQQFERAVAWPGQECRTYLALGYTLGELSDWHAAARALLVVLQAAPGHLRALGSLSECAHRLARRGEQVPRNKRSGASAPAGKREGAISVIVCSIDRAKLARLQANLQALLCGEDWELIHIADARSLSPQNLVISERRAAERIGQTYAITYSPAHQWYWFPHMRREEALVFKTYESMKDGRARWTAHTAFEDPNTAPNARPRESIEIRAFAFF